MPVSVEEAKRIVFNDYGIKVVEKGDLGMYDDQPVKGRADFFNKEAEIRQDADISIKLIAIAHEVGHLIDYQKTKGKDWFTGHQLRVEKRAWSNGLPIAQKLGISQEYIKYQEIHLAKLQHSTKKDGI